MRPESWPQKSITHSAGCSVRLALAAVALFAMATVGRAESVDFSPAALTKQRAAITLKATHAPMTDLQNDLDHLAVLSETCRVESGAKACGLSEKPLASTTLEDRYDYYVRKPTQARASERPAKIDRHNWEAPAVASH